MAVASLFEDLLDQYKIEQHIAEKRYTNLYQAYDVDDDRQVRLEILRPEVAEDSSFAGRFVNRARALAQVRHPNIAQVLHIGKGTNGAPYVAQATVDGYSLSHRLEQLTQRNTPVNPIYALKLIRQLTDALVLAERLELFHYDLQPDNILLKNVTLPTDDSVVLIDLFIPAERQSRGDASAGKPSIQEYLSPEQRSDKEVTAASHVYSLGAMLYRLLAGRMPNRPVTRQDSVLDRLFGRATPLERERDDLSQTTYTLIDRSLRKDPRGRYQTIEAFNVALDGALAAEETRLGTAGARAPIIDRRPLAWLLPLLIVTLFLAVGAVATRSLVTREVEQAGVTPVTLAESVVPVGSAFGAGETPTESAATATTAAATEAATMAGETPAAGGGAGTSAAADASATPEPSMTGTPTEDPTATPTLSPTPSLPRVRVMHNLVNLRRGPGIVYGLFGNVVGGEILEVLAWNEDRANPWYLILTEDQRIGWIAATVVQAENAEALASVPVAATFPPTPIPTFTQTPTPTIATLLTPPPTLDPGDLGGGGATRPPVNPTAPPTEPPIEPSKTPPPFPPEP